MGVSSYVLNRILQAVITLFAILTIIFFLTTVLGDPVAQLLPPDATPEAYAQLRAQLGYDRPLFIRYADFIWSALRGDFGESVFFRRPAMSVVLERLPLTGMLAAIAVAAAAAIGIPFGLLAGYFPGSTTDRGAIFVSTVGLAFPNFVLGILLIYLFGVKLKWLPVAGVNTWQGIILPAACLAIWALAAQLRFARAGAIESLSQPYVLLARSKGLTEGQVMRDHVLRASLLPIITFGSLQFGMLLSGAVVIESVFALPGVGKLALDSVLNRDSGVVQAVVFVIACSFIAINLITDLAYGLVDPRVRLAKGASR